MKYLILGSKGQIGLSLCQYLRGVGHQVQEFDIVDGGRYDLRRPFNPTLRQALKDNDFCYFLAWDVGGSTYLEAAPCPAGRVSGAPARVLPVDVIA